MPRSRSRRTTSRLKVLTSFRCLEGERVTSSGFGRSLSIRDEELVLESPDAFPVGQVLDLEFLLDDDQIADARGHVTRINKGKSLYRVKIEIDKLPAKSRRLLARQVAG